MSDTWGADNDFEQPINPNGPPTTAPGNVTAPVTPAAPPQPAPAPPQQPAPAQQQQNWKPPQTPSYQQIAQALQPKPPPQQTMRPAPPPPKVPTPATNLLPSMPGAQSAFTGPRQATSSVTPWLGSGQGY
jgi:hypothetical protein